MASADRPSASAEGSADQLPPVALDQLFDADSLFQLRSAVAAHGADLSLTEPGLGDLVLVAHELASNAVRHGRAGAGDPGRLRLWRDGDSVVIEVSDHGPGMVDPDKLGRIQAPTGASGGRGLWIARQVMRRLDFRTGATGTTVTAWLRMADPV
jgi:anti-sigma regulatory factor (Ser/Thr protein kinase)